MIVTVLNAWMRSIAYTILLKCKARYFLEHGRSTQGVDEHANQMFGWDVLSVWVFAMCIVYVRRSFVGKIINQVYCRSNRYGEYMYIAR